MQGWIGGGGSHQAWRIEKHESGNSFIFWKGDPKGVSEKVDETLGKAPPPLNDRLPRTVSAVIVRAS